MKTKKSMLVATLLTTMSFSIAMANDQGILNSDPININGYVTQEPTATDAELENVRGELRKQKSAIIINKEKKKKYGELSRSTEKLADVTEEMIEERKESQNTIDRFNKKIDCLMAEGFKEGCEEFVKKPVEDKVVVSQAAPVVAAPIEAPTSGDNFGEKIRVMPYTGLTTFASDNETLEAGLVGGIRVETNINKRFSVGMGFKYTSMTTEDFGGDNYFQGGYYDYYNTYYGGREIEYKSMNFNLYSKFYMVKNERFRPYIGGGIGYNRTTMEYSDNSSASSSYNGQYYGYNFGNEEVITSNLNIELLLGSEIKFTEGIGANLELAYARGLGGNISSEKGRNAFYAPDQQRLEDLSAELSEANIISIFAGLLIEF